jgi:CelD/BcsL family acetyltransferase involved in cellulose biosynthesis
VTGLRSAENPAAERGSAPHARAALIRPSDLSTTDRIGWRDLLTSQPLSAPFMDEAWVSAWTTAFQPSNPLFVCAWDADGLVGLGAVQGITESWGRRRMRVLQSLTNVETFRFDFLAADGRLDVPERLWRTLCDPHRWDVIRIEFVPEDSATLRVGVRVAEELGWTHFLDPMFESPWRPLPHQGSAWDTGLDRKFKSNLRNRERRLGALGDVTFSVARDRTDQRAALDIFYVLEASGWKAERGTAIAQRASVKAFYDGLFEQTAAHVWIPVLSVAGRPAAAQLLRVEGGTLFLLKTAYDPAFAPYAPGQLITARLIRYAQEHDVRFLDFLGEDMPWKRDWEPQLRPHYCLHLFAPSTRGRYAYWTRYGVRESAKRIPGAVPLVRWMRSLSRRGNGNGG